MRQAMNGTSRAGTSWERVMGRGGQGDRRAKQVSVSWMSGRMELEAGGGHPLHSCHELETVAGRPGPWAGGLRIAVRGDVECAREVRGARRGQDQDVHRPVARGV